MSVRILYLHGAGGTAHSFFWLFGTLPAHIARFHLYEGHDGLAAEVARVRAELDGHDTESVVLLGHSLGGVLAAICLDHPAVRCGVTLCAPFGGIVGLSMHALFNGHALARDLGMFSPILTALRQRAPRKPMLGIVGTHGLPFVAESGDGVVSLASQQALSGVRYESVPLNHFEVLLSPAVATLVTDFAFAGQS